MTVERAHAELLLEQISRVFALPKPIIERREGRAGKNCRSVWR